jgi:hypothetical protein
MSAPLGIDLSGVALRLDGLPAEVGERLARDWRRFAGPVSAAPFLRVEVEPFDAGELREPFRPKAMVSRPGPTSAQFEMPEGTAEVRGDTTRVRLARDLGERGYQAFHNLLRASLAWRLPDRGGAMLHAAGLVVGGRAFVLAGPEGSGKSTWVRHGEAAGARAISDDVVVVDRASGRLEALGTPFCSTHRIDYRPGRWPVAAILWPEHGSNAALADTPPLLARAKLAASLPFLAEGLGTDPRVGETIEGLCRARCLRLTFPPDPSFVPVLAAFAG